MRKKSTRVTALMLAALLTISPAASASQALGTEIHMGTSHLAEGVDYTRQYLWSATYSDLRTESYIAYTPNRLVQPTVAYGDTVLSKNTLSSLAERLVNDGKRVLGGINGDYFVVATGAPLGMVVTDGVLRSSSSYYHALGFDKNGNAFIGQPELSITATFGNSTYAVSGGLNKVRTETGGYVLYTSDYGATTLHSEPGIDVILTPSTRKLGQTVRVDLDVKHAPDLQEQPDIEIYNPITGLFESFTSSADLGAGNVLSGSESIRKVNDTLVYTDIPVIGGRISCTVEQVLSSEKSIDIPEGSLVLSINSKDSEWLVQALSSLRQGETVDIDITSDDARWKNAVTAVGGLYKMVTNGAVEPKLETSQAPRTAVGIKADGSVIFYTVDGRQSGYSVGASMEQVAKRLIELGCVEAMCMDGGGSTTIGATLPGEDGFHILNKPSDGSERSVSNALFLVADQAAPGRAEHLAITPGDAIILSGSQLELAATSTDRLGQPVQQYQSNQVTYDLPAAAGTVSNGVLIAGMQPGTYTLEARAGSLSGSSLITVVSKPDRIKLYNEETGTALSSIHADPGETLNLTAGAIYRNLPLVCQDENFIWEVSEGLGTIDQSGTLTAAQTNATGTITVRIGEISVEIPLTVSGHIHTVENFEGSFDLMASSDTASIKAEKRSSYVRYGKQSAVITYSMNEQSPANINTAWTLQEDETYLSLWVYGNGSGNTLTASIRNTDGSTSALPLAVLNFTGWQRLVIPLPSGTKRIVQLTISPTGNNLQGTVWLDQVSSSNQFAPDDTVPDVLAGLIGATLYATLQDNMGETFTSGQISVTYDGTELTFKLSDNVVTATLPERDGLAHRVTVTATDSSGNIGRSSLDIAAAAERETPFTDMGDHWAESYVNYLYDQGISTGVASGDTFLFQPAKNITRGEFALMIARWMRLDLTAYSSVQLPFADTADIPAWCLDAVKAMYALGIMQGSSNGNGSATYAYAGQSISRAEALTMLGRVQAKGHAAADLSIYTDASKVPSWAADYIATMVGQGVISGRPGGTLAPMTPITRCEIAKILYAMR